MNVNNVAHPESGLFDSVAAELTEAAYSVALQHRTVASSIDLKLDLGKVISETLQSAGLGLFRGAGGSKAQGDARPTEPKQTRAMRERLVTYYGLNEAGEPTSRRFLSYKVIAGPGPTEDSGLASIVILALSNPSEPRLYYETFHTVEEGGPAAAMAAAIQYLDACHNGQRLQKVESDVCC
jgi:hypothetical protein